MRGVSTQSSGTRLLWLEIDDSNNKESEQL